MLVAGWMQERWPAAAVAAGAAVEHGRAVSKFVLAIEQRAGHGIGQLDVALATGAMDQLGSDFTAHEIFSGFGTTHRFYPFGRGYY